MKQCPKCSKRFLNDDTRKCDLDGSVLHVVILASAKDRLVNSVIEGRYLCESVLGDGGMGVVYRARGLEDGTLYAIKVLRSEYSDEPDLVNRFQLEAESVAKINHENIVRVFEFGTLEDQSRYFVMEYLQGQGLGQLLNARGKIPGTDRNHPLTEGLAIRIAIQMCAGLSAAHDLGIVHRDMKPDNVHLIPRGAEDYFVKVLDFGIAKVQGAKAARTRTGSVFGTPHYMSPEQAQGERDIDARTDVYAVGVLMYQMVSGRVPFDAENLMGILTAHLYQHPKPLRDVVEPGTVSDGLEAVIFKALAKARSERYDSMAALRADLERVQYGERPIALSEEELLATSRVSSREEIDAIRMLDGGSGVNNDGLTVPVGRMSVRPEAIAPVVPMATGTSIPPVTAAPAPRNRTSLLVAFLSSVGVVTLTAAGLFAFRRVDNPSVHALPPTTIATTPATAAPLTPVPPVVVLSATVHLESTPPGATVYNGTQALGVTPLDVPRPALGAQANYALDREGRLRTAVLVTHDAPAALTVALAESAPTPAETDHGQRGPRHNGQGRRDLLDPWSGDQR